MISLRKNFSNKYKDIATYLIEVWKENDVVDNIVFEYEQYWEFSQEYNEIKDKSLKKELLGFYEELWKHETKQVWLDVMQVYADMNLYDIASRIMDKVNEFDIKQEYDLKELSQNEIEKGVEFEFDRETLDYIEILLRGREDMYTKEYIDANKNRKCEYIPEPLTKEIVKQHLNGKETVGTTGYLSHFERLSILNVFGHVGEDGKDFVHKVMSFTLNYQYNTTQKFIDRLPGKPISCIKLREQYKQITAEYGCSCVFKRTKNCYPSPVIHAIKNGDEKVDITIPASRKMSKEKEQVVYDEINTHHKVQELAEKIVELKKQKRGVDKSIRKVEKELALVFDNANVDCMEVDMGILYRRKKDDSYDWFIEI